MGNGSFPIRLIAEQHHVRIICPMAALSHGFVPFSDTRFCISFFLYTNGIFLFICMSIAGSNDKNMYSPLGSVHCMPAILADMQSSPQTSV